MNLVMTHAEFLGTVIVGGEGESAYGCTGGRQQDRSSCFNFRLMWRCAFDGPLYLFCTD